MKSERTKERQKRPWPRWAITCMHLAGDHLWMVQIRHRTTHRGPSLPLVEVRCRSVADLPTAFRVARLALGSRANRRLRPQQMVWFPRASKDDYRAWVLRAPHADEG